MRWIKVALLMLSAGLLQAQKPVIDRIDPPNWWTGMETNTVQLLIYGSDLAGCTVTNILGEPEVKSVHDPGNGNYLFVDLYIPPGTAPGDYKLTVEKGRKKQAFLYPVMRRESPEGRYQGFSQEDVIYLLMPDRFANGDPSNDQPEGFPMVFDRANPAAWHGGDIQGIIDHLDYFVDLGVTALWLNPILENRIKGAYHGYAATDLYHVDPRFGTNELFRELVDKAHEKGLKIIFDHVLNHIGTNHRWIQEGAPTPTWFNGSLHDHEEEGHYQPSIHDPYATPDALELTQTAWFVDVMADMNQNDPRMLKYLIDQSIWWIEFSGMDGIREDTYPYAFPEAAAAWTDEILANYPDFNIVGESWGTTLFTALYQKGNSLGLDFPASLPSVMDFGLMTELRRFISGEGRFWNIYERLGHDFIFGDPTNLVSFFENHDTHRPLLDAADPRRVELALQFLLTTRGIPQILYGVELGMKGGYSHVELRLDFPGGWPEDQRSAFSREGRTEEENQWFDFVQGILSLRAEHAALRSGELMHMQPNWQGIYAYKRSHSEGDVLVVLHEKDEERDWKMYDMISLLGKAQKLTDLQTGETIELDEDATMKLQPVSGRIFSISY